MVRVSCPRANANIRANSMLLRLLSSVLIMLCFGSHVMHAQDAANLKRIKAIINNVNAAYQRNGLSDPRDRLSMMSTMPEFHALQKEIYTNWRTALQNIELVTSGVGDQIILFRALQALPPQEFVDALTTGVELCAQGKVQTKPVLLPYFMFTSGSKWGFLEVNYQEPAVVQLLQNLKKLDPSDASISKIFDEILSGRGKITVEQNIKDNPDYQDRSIQALLIHPPSAVLPDPHDAKRVGPPTPRHAQGADLTNPPTSAPVAVISNEPDARNSRFYVWSALATAVLLSVVWLFLRSRKSRGAG